MLRTKPPNCRHAILVCGTSCWQVRCLRPRESHRDLHRLRKEASSVRTTEFCRPRSASLKKTLFSYLQIAVLDQAASFNLSCPLNSDKEVARTVDWHHTQIRQQKHSAKVWTVYHYFTTCLRCLHFWQNRGNEPCFCNRGLMARGSFLSLPHNTKELKLKCL